MVIRGPELMCVVVQRYVRKCAVLSLIAKGPMEAALTKRKLIILQIQSAYILLSLPRIIPFWTPCTLRLYFHPFQPYHGSESIPHLHHVCPENHPTLHPM